MNGWFKSTLVLSAFSFTFAAAAQTAVKSLTWNLKKEQWSAVDEKNYQEFIRGIGRAKEKRLCSTTENCIKNKEANPLFYARNPKELKIYSDCADLPYILRGYFAWMNDLPFSYPTALAKADPNDPKSDLRYNRGNKVTKRNRVVTGDNVNKVLSNVANFISSAMFRIPPQRDVEGSASVYTDFYSPKITRTSIVPGTVVYDPNGHVLVVYDVTDDGRIFMIDAHPDNSLTRAVYGEKFVRSTPSAGSGFKNWRPVTAAGAAKNSEIADYSLDQFYGTGNVAPVNGSWKNGTFLINGETVPYYDYVRRILSKGNMRFHPVTELREMLRSLCEDLKDRKSAVDDAIKVGIHKQAHPVRLPDNIYGTHGDWESYSSPSRDARFKAAIREVRNKVEEFIEKERNNDATIDYTGNNLVADLKKVQREETLACSISYTNSKGVAVNINLEQAMDRAFALSFDPYHCIELRWGAEGQELASCPDDQNKRAWYTAQQRLRNSIDRNYDIRMDKTLSELPTSGLGEAQAADINLKKFLESR